MHHCEMTSKCQNLTWQVGQDGCRFRQEKRHAPQKVCPHDTASEDATCRTKDMHECVGARIPEFQQSIYKQVTEDILYQ